MKLKNSYILLIAMAIFLLVSMSSVCASDIADDATGSTDDGVLGDESVSESSKIDTTIDCKDLKFDNDTYDTEKPSIPVAVKDNNNTTLIITKEDLNVAENDKNIGFDYTDSKIIITDKLAMGKHNLVITYLGNNAFKNATKSIDLSIYKSINIEPVNTEVYYQEGNFTFKVTDKNGIPLANVPLQVSGFRNNSGLQWTIVKNTTFNLVSAITITTDEEGIATLPNKNFETGFILSNLFYPSASDDYKFTLKGTGGYDGTKTTNAVIKQIKSKITISNFSEAYNSNKYVKITVVNKDTNKPLVGVPVNFKVTNSTGSEMRYVNSNGTKINTLTTNENGVVSIPMNNLIAGQYTIEASVNDSANVVKSNAKNTATIKKAQVVISGNVVTSIYYGTGNLATLVITDKATGARVPNAIVLFRVYTGSKYVSYLGQANERGIISPFKVPVAVGTHKIVISLYDSRYTGSSLTKYVTVKKASAKFSAPQVTSYYKQGKYFTVKVVNTKNNQPMYGANINIRVYVSSNSYYQYSGTTGTDGTIKFGINLAPKTYKIVVINGDTKNYAAKQVNSKIVVNKAPTKLTPTKLSAKKGTDTYFKVVATNSKTNKAISGISLKLQVYTGNTYKTYTIKTDSNGIAQFNVKSLSAGTHKVVVTSCNKYCVASAASSTITIKN